MTAAQTDDAHLIHALKLIRDDANKKFCEQYSALYDAISEIEKKVGTVAPGHKIQDTLFTEEVAASMASAHGVICTLRQTQAAYMHAHRRLVELKAVP